MYYIGIGNFFRENLLTTVALKKRGIHFNRFLLLELYT
mgnify:CR=1 FL=1